MQERTADGSVEETGRALRQRSALPPYRPRPQLTSSDRGKANAELRRQRELEANVIFTEANEMISHVKAVASSSVDGDESLQEDAAMEIEVDAALSFDGDHLTNGVGQSSSPAESSGVAALTKALPLASSLAQGVSLPAAKKARTEDDDEFDDLDDDVFFENLVANDSIDWENGSSRAGTASARGDENDGGGEQEVDEHGYDLVRKLREKHPETQGFRWSSEKQVVVAPEARERGRMVIEKIKMEVEREDASIASETSSIAGTISPAPRQLRPSRPPLAPIPNSTLNRSSLGTARMMSSTSTIQEGKRKLQEESETSQTSSAQQFRPSSSLVSTPDRRLPSVRPTGSPLSQTPNPARSALRLGTTLRTSTPLHSTPLSSTPSKASTSVQRTPRISLGMTPRRAVSGSVPKFKTPFKDSNLRQGTSSSTHRSPDLFKIPPVNRGVSSPCVMGEASAKRAQDPPVRQSIFNLDGKQVNRQSLQSIFKGPESTSHDDANENLTMEVFDAIVQILRQPKRGLKYAFGVDGDFVGREGVLAMLKQAIGTEIEVQKEWIDNHYVLILWKMAAYTRHILDERYWHWEEMCRQFRYRYEREFNCKHRSAVKRILREDCPSSRPMVLCVYEIPPFDERSGPGQTIILTDGWYKIQAIIDRVLCLAIYGKKYQEDNARTRSKPVPKPKPKQKHTDKADFTAASTASKAQEKHDEEEEEEETVCLPYLTETDRICVKVGSKLAIQGAGLETSTEGADPLKAFERARISIGGNSARLARWDARLGFSKASFISTIRSLNAGGGKVPLMDVVVTRLYPIAFTGLETCPGYEDEDGGFRSEWNEAEEEERRRAWEKHREKMFLELQQEQEEETQDLRRICEELEQAYEGLSHDESLNNAIDASSCQDMLHAIITAGSTAGYLGMTQLIPKLRELAYKKLTEVRERLDAEVDSSLQNRLSTRKVRSFRVVRFRDATPEDHGRIGSVSSKRQQCQRGVQVRIWDYSERIEAGHDVAQREGDHFMVTNLVPSRLGTWPKTDAVGDIDLTSGPASIWRLVKRAAKAENK